MVDKSCSCPPPQRLMVECPRHAPVPVCLSPVHMPCQHVAQRHDAHATRTAHAQTVQPQMPPCHACRTPRAAARAARRRLARAAVSQQKNAINASSERACARYSSNETFKPPACSPLSAKTVKPQCSIVVSIYICPRHASALSKKLYVMSIMN